MNRDIVQQLSKYTDDRTLVNLLRTNKDLYYNEYLLRAIFLAKYPHLKYLKTDYMTWRELLLETIRIIAKMKEEYGFDYYQFNEGNPKDQYETFGELENKKDMEGLLILAAKNGQLLLVKFALANGADIHAVNDLPLQLASENGHLDIVKYLVENGADIHADGDYALQVASRNGHLEVVKYLIGHDANIHAYHDLALRLARNRGHLDIVRYLSGLP